MTSFFYHMYEVIFKLLSCGEDESGNEDDVNGRVTRIPQLALLS